MDIKASRRTWFFGLIAVFLTSAVATLLFLERGAPDGGEAPAPAGYPFSREFDDRLRVLERDAGTSSSFRMYCAAPLNLKKGLRPSGLLRALEAWEAEEGRDARATTESLIREIVQANGEAFDLLARGAELDAPLWPAGVDAQALRPDSDVARGLARLVLARARMAADTGTTGTLDDALLAMTLGRHMQCPNALLLSVWDGMDARRRAAEFLLWLVSRQSSPLEGAGALAVRLERERRGTPPILEHVLSHLRLTRNEAAAQCDRAARESRGNPAAIARLRGRLIQGGNPDALKMSDAQVLDALSSTTLGRRYEEIMALAREFAGLGAARQFQDETLYVRFRSARGDRLDPLGGAGRERFAPVAIIPKAFFQRALEEAQLRFLITTLALQAAGESEPGKALARLGIAAEAGIDPFTNQAFVFKTVGEGRGQLQGAPMALRRKLGLERDRVEGVWEGHEKPYEFPLSQGK